MCDICVLYLLKKKYFYRNKKYQYVDDPDASEDEASFPVRFTCLGTRLADLSRDAKFRCLGVQSSDGVKSLGSMSRGAKFR
jgi:hypothetical protein